MNNTLEHIAEAYIQGKLSSQEALQFEQTLASDPNLKEEFEFQKNIIEGVKEFRKAELKAYLNTVPVSTSLFNPLQYAAMFAAASVVGGLLLLFVQVNKRFANNEASVAVVQPKVEETKRAVPVEPIASEMPEVKTYDPSPESVAPKEVVKEKISTSIKEKVQLKNRTSVSEVKVVTKNTRKEEVINRESIDPDMVSANDFETKSISAPQGEMVASTLDKKTNIGVTLASAISKGSLHYQYFNNKLYLYGNFNKSTYELIEMYTNKKKNLYMYFDSQFYELEQNTYDITEMKALNSSELVSELKKLIRVN